MDIIKHGKYQIQKYKMKCYVCGCEFTYAESDIHGYDMLHKPLYVNCPECHKWNRHDYGFKLSKEVNHGKFDANN